MFGLPNNASRNTKLGSVFQEKVSPSRAMGNAVGAMKMLLGARGVWSMSSITETPTVIDLSGQGRTLTYNGNPVFDVQGLLAYIKLDGTGDYLSRADEAGLDILGTETYITTDRRGLTMGLWIYYDNAASTAEFGMGKDENSTNTSYRLLRKSTGEAVFGVCVDGVAGNVVTVDSASTLSATTWYHVVGRFEPSTELAVFVNGVKTVNTTSIPASIFNGTADFTIGGYSGGTALMTGRVGLAFLCASHLPDAVIQTIYHEQRGMFPPV